MMMMMIAIIENLSSGHRRGSCGQLASLRAIRKNLLMSTSINLDCAIPGRLFAGMLRVAHEIGHCYRRRATLYLFLTLIIIISLGGGATRILATGESMVVEPGFSASQDKAANNSTLLYECEISYVQMDMSLIKFSINYLELTSQPDQLGDDDSDGLSDSFKLTEIGYEAQPSQLRALTKLNASLPFVFFINGFNTFGPADEINATWMYDVAKSFASRPGQQEKDTAAAAAGSVVVGPRNVIFLTWSIPNLFASNLLSMIPAYYKTVANYDLIMDCVTRTLAKLIAFVDSARRFETPLLRLDYFRSWHFYGHSLGSHILSDAISRVVALSVPSLVTVANSTTGGSSSSSSIDYELHPLKFGKLVGLDPATPCFVSREYGISSSKVARAVQEVLVLHSNAGFAGVPNERANLEIVLNGGTFQPGCAWYDFTCHHVRSTDILSYLDDQCQMVAYKCTSYHHFKLGACETCYGPPSAPVAAKLTPDRYERLARNCVLVNLPEQHRDAREMVEYAEQFEDELRQLAEVVDTGGRRAKTTATTSRRPTIELFKRLDELERREREQVAAAQVNVTTTNEISKSLKTGQKPLTGSDLESKQAKAVDGVGANKARKSYYHFVSTSPNFRFGRKTHCLQHYQLRLLIYYNGQHGGNETKSLQEKCKLSSYYVSSSEEIQLKMYYESEPFKAPYHSKLDGPKLAVPDDSRRQMSSSSIKLSGIIKDLFHTTLVNFEGPPRLFTGAQLLNIDWSGMSECLLREGAMGNETSGGPNFVLDIAFMSHTNHKIRHAFSSVLCGQLDPRRGLASFHSQNVTQRREAKDDTPGEEELTLRLCKRSDLTDVSSQIDKLLDHMRLHRLNETWKVSLLNSLFSLFTEWEPF